jgi:hypothetical protein
VQRDGVPGELAGVGGVGAGSHEQPAGAEPVEEVLFVAGGAGSGVDQASEVVAGYFVTLLAGGLFSSAGFG